MGKLLNFQFGSSNSFLTLFIFYLFIVNFQSSTTTTKKHANPIFLQFKIKVILITFKNTKVIFGPHMLYWLVFGSVRTTSDIVNMDGASAQVCTLTWETGLSLGPPPGTVYWDGENKTYCLTLQNKKLENIFFTWTVSVISSDHAMMEMPNLQQYPRNLNLIKNVEDTVVFLKKC